MHSITLTTVLLALTLGSQGAPRSLKISQESNATGAVTQTRSPLNFNDTKTLAQLFDGQSETSSMQRRGNDSPTPGPDETREDCLERWYSAHRGIPLKPPPLLCYSDSEIDALLKAHTSNSTEDASSLESRELKARIGTSIGDLWQYGHDLGMMLNKDRVQHVPRDPPYNAC